MARSSLMGAPVLAGEQYCLPTTAQYTIENETFWSSNNRWNVTDESGAVVFKVATVKSNPSAWFPKYVTLLVGAHGNLVARLTSKGSLEWEVMDGNTDDVLCTVTSNQRNLNVFRTSTQLQEKNPEYRTKLNDRGPWKLFIVHGIAPMAEVVRKRSTSWFESTKHNVTVNAGADGALVFLLAIIVFNVLKMEQDNA